MKSKKEIARLRKIHFMDNILPFIDRDYDTIHHEHMVKISVGGRWIDYYPGAQKLMICGSGRYGEWHDMTIDNLLFRLKIKM